MEVLYVDTNEADIVFNRKRSLLSKLLVEFKKLYDGMKYRLKALSFLTKIK